MKPNNELDELAIKYGTDKFGKHHYTQVYYDLFAENRLKVNKILEIGPAEGAGLFMFRDFFPNATIYGMEIDEKRVAKLQGLERIKVFKGDQSDFNNLRDAVSYIQEDTKGVTLDTSIDLIIDDGSHNPQMQFATCAYLMSKFKNDFIYVIEDLTSTAHAVFTLLGEMYNCQLIRVGTRHDDQMVIVRRNK